MKYIIDFTEAETDFLIQVINRFLMDVPIKNFPLKTKLLLNEKSFYEDEIIFLYLYLRKFKEIIEKHLDNTITNDENLILNYKGINHCLRKCRKSLEEHGKNPDEVKISFDEFIKSFL